MLPFAGTALAEEPRPERLPARDTAELADARVRMRPNQAPGVQAIPLETLRRRENLADALKTVPGFRVRSQSGLGGYSEAWFRGADGRQITVYLDGIPLRSSLEPSADLGKIPALMIHEMTVDRAGFGPGADPEGGAAAVRLSTSPLGRSPVNVSGRLSSFGGREAIVAAKLGLGAAAAAEDAPAWGNAALHLGAGLLSARNDFPFPSDNGTRYLGSDDSRPAFANNGYSGRYLSLAWIGHGDGSRSMSLAARYDAHRKEYPGLYTGQSRAYTLRDETLLHARWNDTLDLGPVEGFGASVLSRTFSDGFRDPGNTLGYRSRELDRDGRVLCASLGLRVALPLGARLRAGTRAGYESSDSRETEGFSEFPAPDAERLFLEPSAAISASPGRGLSARIEGVLSAERLESEAVAGIAGSRRPVPLERDAAAHTLRAALSWEPPAGAGTDDARGGGSRWSIMSVTFEAEAAERHPALYEILGDNNGILKNMELAPQASYGMSLEGAFRAGPFRVAAGPFWQRVDSPIRLGSLGASDFLRFGNGRDYRSLGLEARLDAEGARWRVGNAFTASRPAILEGRPAGNLPAYASAIENLAEASLSPVADVWMDADLEFRTGYFPDDQNLPGTRRPAETLFGTGLRWRIRRLEAAFRADNLGDAHYRDFAYSPKSGRRYSFRLSMNP
jgi:hypothetical protein